MQLQMSFLETAQSPEIDPVWPTLEQPQKDAVVATLARLIARAADEKHLHDVDAEACNE